MIIKETVNCVITGAELFKLLSHGQITKGEALIKIKSLAPEASVEEADALLSKINSMVYGRRST